MCVLAMAWKAAPRWLMVAAANRDELHARPSARLSRRELGGLISGRDLRAGGTWLAVSERGTFAAVTNLARGAATPAGVSRGLLVDRLTSSEALPLPAALAQYNPFNAVRIWNDEAIFLTNDPKIRVHALLPGVHAMSNGPFDEPWTKSTRLSAAIADWSSQATADVEQLFVALRDPRPLACSDGQPRAIFVEGGEYGTRCSTLVLIDRERRGTIIERSFDATGKVAGEISLGFTWRAVSP